MREQALKAECSSGDSEWAFLTDLGMMTETGHVDDFEDAYILRSIVRSVE